MDDSETSELSFISSDGLVVDDLILEAQLEMETCGISSLCTRRRLVELTYCEKLDLAQELIDALAKAARESLGQQSYNTLHLMANLGAIYEEAEKYSEATLLLVEALDGMKSLDEHPDLLFCKTVLAKTYKHQQHFTIAQSLLTEILEDKKQRPTSRENQLDVAATQFDMASIYIEQKFLDEARSLFVMAKRVWMKELGPRHPKTLTAILRLALVYNKQGRSQDAKHLLTSLKSIIVPELSPEHPDILSLASDVASALDDQGLYHDAEDLYRQTLKIAEGCHGQEHSDTLACMENLSCTLVGLGKFDEAEKLQRHIIEAREKTFGYKHARTLIPMAKLAYTRYKQGQYQNAMARGEEVTKTMQDVMGKEHPSTLAALDNLVLVYQELHRFQDAEKIGIDVLACRLRVFGEEDTDTLSSKANLAMTYMNLRSYTKAEKLTEEVLKEGIKALGETHPTMLTWLNNIATAWLETGFLAQAEKLMEIVLESSTKVPGREHPDTIIAMCNLAMCYKKQERLVEALNLMTEATRLSVDQLSENHPIILINWYNIAMVRIELAKKASLVEDPIQNLDAALGVLKSIKPSMANVMGADHQYTIECTRRIHSNWKPIDHPEWLLLEIDNNLLIRPSQIDVARAIISPSSASNSVLQMNMGQERSCRDVLDESDFTLSPKTQLIYPSGIPMMLDGHPQRWKVVEDLLLLVENHVPHLQSEFSDGVEIVRRHHGYPILHFLRDEAEKALSELLIDDICRGRLPQLKFKSTANSSAQRDVGLIVSGADVDPLTWQRAAESLTDDIFGLKSLYLLRGLISQRLLLTCLKKRWNVQYGLHPQRAPIAVPFEAKGVPSPTAEYGHPDTSLVLTCLAFYQTGLTKSQVTQCLQHILRSDDPPTQYERLVSGCKLPAHLEHWNLLNADDDIQIEELWGSLRLDTTVVNYFLNNFAFPAHAKQFGVKLQTSGWDIPLLSSDETSKNLTTGFSGTNNNKRMLPQTIKQDDLPSLVQTNAEVLSYLLEPRSQRCYQAIDRNGRHLTERGLLELLRREQIRVLIDAGAHVLEMSNDQLAAAWLDIYNDAQGAVYFDSNSRIMVHARFQKVPVPLLASPFAENLEQCVVYIDEAHTRGTDLKLPVHARGAVTLGLGQTKDHTVQAAMRLRQLGSTQSVAFIVPPEVYRNVLDLRPDKDRTCSPVTSTDVVYWLLEQSCKANENMMSLHTAQGFDFCQRTNALWKYPNSINRPGERIPLLDAIQKREDRTLEQLYGPRQTVSINEAVDQLEFDRLKLFASTLCQQKLNLPRDHPSAFQEVELQREVEFEFEQVRDKQKPTKFTALKFHGLEPAILHFVNTGHLQEGENFVQAFDFLSRTKLGRKFGVQKTHSRLFVTKEFTRSITNDSCKKDQDIVTETALIVIPEEAELLLPTLRNTSRAGVCLVTYAAPIAKSMRQFNAMTYFTVPTPDKSQSLPKWLCIEIGVIAGRLYFDYSEYPSLVAWLGTSQETGPPNDIPNEFSQETASVTRGLIVDEPLNFLLEWLAHRRQTMDLTHTPMGYVCQGRNLHSDHPFFASATTSRVSDEAYHDVQSDAVNNHTGRATGSSDDDSDWGLTDEEEMALPTVSNS
ncbi:hypothetical protein FPRO03_14144 [Fusarium proliferatum]|nr:hypothetical protein FPRO03_14144 [Fusarium proliferatum]